MCNNVSCPRTGLSLGLELIITEWDSVLLIEMLFFDSMLTIIIVTKLAWEPYLKTCPPDYTAMVYFGPRRCSEAILPGWSHRLFQDVCLGGESGGALTTSRYSFSLFSAVSWEVSNALLKIVGMGALSTPFWCLCQKLFFTFSFLFFFFHEK